MSTAKVYEGLSTDLIYLFMYHLDAGFPSTTFSDHELGELLQNFALKNRPHCFNRSVELARVRWYVLWLEEPFHQHDSVSSCLASVIIQYKYWLYTVWQRFDLISQVNYKFLKGI